MISSLAALAAADDGTNTSVWSNPLVVNGLIGAIILVVIEVLRRRFGKRDTAYDRVVNQLSTLQADMDWCTDCLHIVDDEVWALRRLAGAAGITLPERPPWPERPPRPRPAKAKEPAGDG